MASRGKTFLKLALEKQRLRLIAEAAARESESSAPKNVDGRDAIASSSKALQPIDDDPDNSKESESEESDSSHASDPTYKPTIQEMKDAEILEDEPVVTLEPSTVSVFPEVLPLEGAPEKVLPAATLGVKARKRKLNPSGWKVNERKMNRAHGSPYCSSRGKFVPGKIMGPPCHTTCRNKCNEKVTLGQRQVIFQRFWDLGDYTRQKDLIHSNTDRYTKKTGTTAARNSRRKMSTSFYLPLNGNRVNVCKTMFLNTLGIKKGVVDIAMAKRTTENVSTGDRRGKHVKKCLPDDVKNCVRKHIEQFPAVPSHYCRKDSKRLYLSPDLNIRLMYNLYEQSYANAQTTKVSENCYRKIFTEEYNLGFHRPKKDQCRLCYMNEKGTQDESMKEHVRLKERARTEKASDKALAAASNETTISINFDLQQVLMVPTDVKNNALFYKRRLATYNFCIYNVVTQQGMCFMWHEGQGGRGSCEIASALFTYFKQLPPTVTQVLMFSDKCGGQNLNKYVAGMCVAAVQLIPHLNIIDLKFHVVGHSEMECDSMHAAIGREGKRVGKVYCPLDWQTIAASARRHGDRPYEVVSLKSSDIIDWKLFVRKTMVVCKTDTNKEPVLWQKATWLRFSKSKPLIIEMKVDFDSPFRSLDVNPIVNPVPQTSTRTSTRTSTTTSTEASTSTLNVNPRSRKQSDLSSCIKPVYTTAMPISKAKYDDLQALCKMKPPAIPEIYHHFYNGLIFNQNVRDTTVLADVEDMLTEEHYDD